MRYASKSEQEKAEIEASERRDRRAKGFDLAKNRDRGWGKIRDLSGNEVTMLWHVDHAKHLEGVVYKMVPDNCFGMVIEDKYVVFDAEEFRRHLRWA